MKIILLKDVKKLGKKYDIKEVADGHAINMLIPNGFAIIATPNNINMVEIKKKRDITNNIKTEDEFQRILNSLKEICVEIRGKVNEKGNLFAGIHEEEITDAIKKQKGINLLPEYITLEKPIKEIGDHNITVKISGKSVTFKLTIKAKTI